MEKEQQFQNKELNTDRNKKKAQAVNIAKGLIGAAGAIALAVIVKKPVEKK